MADITDREGSGVRGPCGELTEMQGHGGDRESRRLLTCLHRGGGQRGPVAVTEEREVVLI